MTASHQTSRTASVRAITETSVNVIEGRDFEKLVKDMPFWANVLIKDLVYRLNFMNEMYVLSVTKDNQALQRNELISSAIRLAKGILANAKVHQKQYAEGTFINLSLVVAPLLDVYISEKDNFQKIYSLFIESHLLELRDLDTPGKYLSKSELHGFQVFFELANKYLENNEQDSSTTFPVLSERKVLFDLAQWVKGLSVNPDLDVVSVDMGMIEDRLAIAKMKRPNIFPLIQKAEDHGMLTIYKATGRISIYPDKMRHILASMNILKALDQMSPKEKEKEKAIEAEPALEIEEA